MVKKSQPNLKIEITNYLIKTFGLSSDEKTFKKVSRVWWQNPRIKAKGGLKLTEPGYNAFKRAEIKEYRILFEKPDEVLCNKHVIWLDHLMDSPWYVDGEEICVFSEHLAIQLTLFSGNLIKFSTAKVKNASLT
jgi:hypothetical protein